MQETGILCKECKVRSNSVFCRVAPGECLEPEKETLTLKRGEYLFEQGQPCAGVYCLQEGQLLVLKDGDDGKALAIAKASPGEMLGLSSLFAGGTYSTSIYSMSESRVCRITRENFEQLVHLHPSVGLNAMTMIAQKLDKLDFSAEPI